MCVAPNLSQNLKIEDTPRHAILFCDGQSVYTAPNALRVLLLLITAKLDAQLDGGPDYLERKQIYQGAWGNAFMGDWENSVDVQISQLRDALKDGRKHHPDKTNRIIATERGEGYRFLLDVEWHDEQDQTSARHTQSLIVTEDVPFEYLGSNRKALKELIKRIPQAMLIEDTTIPSDEGSLYGHMDEEYVDALRASKAKYTSITGPVQDNAHVEALKLAYDKKPDDLTCFRLHHATPMMNFVLIYKDDEATPTEVFFGYGTEQRRQPGYVFRSNETHLLSEFRRLFWILCDEHFSNKINADDPEFLRSREPECDVLATFPKFPDPIDTTQC